MFDRTRARAGLAWPLLILVQLVALPLILTKLILVWLREALLMLILLAVGSSERVLSVLARVGGLGW